MFIFIAVQLCFFFPFNPFLCAKHDITKQMILFTDEQGECRIIKKGIKFGTWPLKEVKGNGIT